MPPPCATISITALKSVDCVSSAKSRVTTEATWSAANLANDLGPGGCQSIWAGSVRFGSSLPAGGSLSIVMSQANHLVANGSLVGEAYANVDASHASNR
jgi:hypothetical protein